MKKAVLLEADKRMICDQYPKKTIAMLAREYKTSEGRVKEILRSGGIDFHKSGKRPCLTQAQKYELAEAYIFEGITMAKLAERYGVSFSTIERALREQKITANDKNKDATKKEAEPMKSVSVSTVSTAGSFPEGTKKSPAYNRDEKIPPIFEDFRRIMELSFNLNRSKIKDSSDEDTLDFLRDEMNWVCGSIAELATELAFRPGELLGTVEYNASLLTVLNVLLDTALDGLEDLPGITTEEFHLWTMASGFVAAAIRKGVM